MPRALTSALVARALLIVLALVPNYGRALDPPKKVVVILNMGDPGSLGASLAKDQAQAAKVYRSLGYQVIELSNDAKNPSEYATRANLTRTIGDLSGVSDLKIDFLGHGRVQDASDVPPEYKDRFPLIPHTQAEKKAGFEAVDFSTPKVYVAVSVTNRQLTYADEHGKAATKTLLEDSIGAGDMRSLLSDFQKKNPAAQTTVHMLNCFGASMGQELSGMKDVLVFNATENSKTAIQYFDPKTMGGAPDGKTSKSMDLGTLNYMNNYYSELAEEKAHGKKDINYNALHDKVAQKMLDELLPAGRTPIVPTIDLPRSPAQNDLHRWCAANPEGTLAVAPSETKSSPYCHCRVDALFNLLGNNKANDELLKKITLSEITQDVNSISTQAAARLGELVKKYCSAPNQLDPDGAIKKADLAALAKAKEAAFLNALGATDADLKKTEALLKGETPEGKTAIARHDEYRDLLFQLNADRKSKGLISYKSVSDIPTSVPERSALLQKWTSYQQAWTLLLSKNPTLKQKASLFQQSQIASAQALLQKDQKDGLESRIIELDRLALARVQKEFDWMGMLEDAKIEHCFVTGNCSGVPDGRRIQKEADPTEQEKQKDLVLTDLFNTSKQFSKDPKQDAEQIAKICIRQVSLPPGMPGGGNKPVGPPQGHGTGKAPAKKGGPPPGGGIPDRPPQTPSEAHKFNEDLLACIGEKSKMQPYAAALALLNSANLTKDTDGRCPYWKANLDLYREDLKCGERFAASASVDEIDHFLAILRSGERSP